MIWFTADTHFGYSRILQLLPERKFKNIEEMNEKLISAINSMVRPEDELYHLGNFCWSKAGYYRQRIKVHKLHVVQGNHDKLSLCKHVSSINHMMFLKCLLDSDIIIDQWFNYYDFNITKERNIKIHLCHYPLASWNLLHHGGYHLYGHCHGTMELKLNEMFPGRRSMDIGVDAIHRLFGVWRPISLPEVIKYLERKQS